MDSTEYEVVRSFTSGGAQHLPGERYDVAGVAAVRLRQLVAQRYLRPVAESGSSATASQAATPATRSPSQRSRKGKQDANQNDEG